jgi:hypothetical protein
LKISSYLLLIILLLSACKGNGNKPGPPEPDFYAACDQLLYEPCQNSPGEYCLFGYKWGEGNPTEETGVEVAGPRNGGGIITYSFVPAGVNVNTHSATNITSSSFDEFPTCAVTQIKRALADWERIADVTFQEEAEGSDTQIRFITAEIRQTGIGYPNFPQSPCMDIAGDVVFSLSNKNLPCEDGIYPLALHEIGHVLGLGHVQSQNIMSTRFWDDEILAIQSGDSAGIIKIYGTKP